MTPPERALPAWIIKIMDNLDWTLGSKALIDLGLISSTWQGHTLTIHCDYERRNALKSLADQAGKVNIVEYHDGSFEAFDAAETDLSKTLNPAPDYDSGEPYESATYYINGYSERPKGQAAGSYKIELDLVRQTARETTASVSQTRASDEFLLDFGNDAIAVEDLKVTDRGPDDDLEIEFDVHTEGARAILQNPAYQAAVEERSVPQGDDFIEDTNANARNTVTITSPDRHQVYETIPGGEYVIRDWSLEQVAPRRWTVALTARLQTAILTVESGTTYLISGSESETYHEADIDGTLTINGTLTIQ